MAKQSSCWCYLSSIITLIIHMQQFLPVQALGVSFKTDIRKLTLRGTWGRTTLYSADTSFGDMTLILENVSTTQLLQAIQRRNALISSRDLAAPLIYEQEVVKIREDSAICLTLTEPVLLICPAELTIPESAFEGLVRCAYRAAKMTMGYQGGLQRVMLAEHNGGLFMDFTRLAPEEKPEAALEDFKRGLCGLMRKGRGERMRELLFICESPFLFNLERITLCRTWFDLAMLFNLLQHERLTVVTESRSKQLPVIKLTGSVRVHHEGIQYEPFLFRDGFRLDGITELTLQQLRMQFFEEGTVYHMTKEKYMTVRKFPASFKEYPCRIQAQDLIYVRPEVSKVQFINFLIGYIRFVEPLLHQLTFHAQENTLELAFATQLGREKRLGIRFHPKYIVKDEELSMIIEKSKMKAAVVSLRGMAIGDSFLIFLANCDKMAHVRSFDISHCPKITDSALNLLLASPFCKGLTVLKVNGLPLPDLQVIRSRGHLKELQVSECKGEEGDEVQVGALPITRLEALGVPIQMKFPDTLTHLAITQEVALEQLKLLKNLPLVSLKIILVETKKSIGSFFNTLNNLYSKDNPAKVFSQGACRKTLKILDISHSSVRLKDIRPILAIETLQFLSCQGMQRDKFTEIILPHHILSLSLKRSKVNAQLLLQLTQRINFFIKLNIVYSDVTDRTLQTAIRGKKYINWLQVGQDQVGVKFFSKKSAIEGVELHLWRLLRDENEYLLNLLLFSQLSVCKELNLRCDPKAEFRLARKVHRFLSLYQDHLRGGTDLSISINSTPLPKIPLRGPPPSESFTIVNLKTAPHRLKLNARTVLAQEYRLAVTEEQLGLNLFNVALHKVLRLHPDALMEVSLRNNRTIGPEAISLLRRYAAPRLLSLDFRNCIFSFLQVQAQLYEFPHLQSVNDGEYQLSLSGQQCCESALQQVLRFFMRLTPKEKMKLHLKAHAITERELYFSIMFELLHHHSGHIVELYLDLEQLPPDHHAEPFWKEVFLLANLETLRVRYVNEGLVTEAQETNLAVEFEKMVNLNLFCLELQTSIHLIIPSQLSLKDLRRLSISYNGMEISEHTVAKLLKSTPTLHHLTLGLQNCPNISSLGRISDALQRMPALTLLSLNVQNSPIREGSLFELIESLHKNPLLEKLQLNANNCHLDINQLARVCEGLVERVRFCRILIWAMQAKRPAFFRSHADLLALGIDLLFTTPA